MPFIPEGQWLCRRCQLVGRGTPASELPVRGCLVLPFLSLDALLTSVGLHILSERGWCIQTDDSYEMGASVMCHVDTRSFTRQRYLSRAGTRRRKSPEDPLETSKFILIVFCTCTDTSCSLATSASKRWGHAFSVATSRVSRPSMSPVHAKHGYACE